MFLGEVFMAFDARNYKFMIGMLDGENMIWVRFPYDLRLKDELREKFPSARWNILQKCWHLPNTHEIQEKASLASKPVAKKT